MSDENNNVVAFPAREVRQSAGVEAAARDVMAERGHDAEAIAFVVGRLKGSWERMAVDMKITVPDECAPHVQAVVDMMHEAGSRALLELMNAYIEIYQQGADR